MRFGGTRTKLYSRVQWVLQRDSLLKELLTSEHFIKSTVGGLSTVDCLTAVRPSKTILDNCYFNARYVIAATWGLSIKTTKTKDVVWSSEERGIMVLSSLMKFANFLPHSLTPGTDCNIKWNRWPQRLIIEFRMLNVVVQTFWLVQLNSLISYPDFIDYGKVSLKSIICVMKAKSL